jgi:hypothetical protein
MGGAAQDVLNHLLVNLVQSPGHDDTDPEAGDHEDNHSVENRDGREDGNANKPEPKEYIDLLVDNVEGKNTKAIMGRDCSRWTVLVKCALCHLSKKIILETMSSIMGVYLWEDNIHWIRSVFWVSSCHTQDIPAIGGELITEESIMEIFD